uniref:Protein arginine N-methyltransferase domain-containing protein n=1 Tax=Ditylenchus dipsaci TaxID=166011 RepID=A0A915EFB7_9BILA
MLESLYTLESFSKKEEKCFLPRLIYISLCSVMRHSTSSNPKGVLFGARTVFMPVVDSWNIGILISKTVKWSFDFEKDSVEKLHNIDIPFQLQVSRTCFLHGLASWFDVAFLGTSRKIWLSTSPTEPLTHCGQTVKGRLVMTANDKQSYDLKMQIEVNGIQHLNTLDLKTPHFRYNGQSTSLSPPGAHAECPSDQFLQQQTYQYQTIENSAVGHSMSLESIPVPPGISQMTHSTDKKGTFNGFSQSLMTKLIEDENIDVLLYIKVLNASSHSNFFYYFAFGSNLLKERINVQIKGAVFETVGVLKDFQLCFLTTHLDGVEHWHL